MLKKKNINTINKRFRGFYPVIIDIETAGFNCKTDALLEIAAITILMDKNGFLKINEILHFHIKPFPGSKLNSKSLAFNGIKPFHPFRYPVVEYYALNKIFNNIKNNIVKFNCTKAIIVAHNSFFDLSFLNSAIKRNKLKNNPFHKFVTLDTVTLSALIFGETVLAKACINAGINFNSLEAHSALYDSKKTAELFCNSINYLKKKGIFPYKKDNLI